MARPLISVLLGVTSVLCGLAVGILLLLVAISPIRQQHVVHTFPLVAAVVQICSSCFLMVLIFLQFQDFETLRNRKGIVLISSLGLLPSVVSVAIDGASLGWAEASIGNSNVPVFGSRVSAFLTTTFIVWSVTVLTLLVYYFHLAWHLRSGIKPSRCSMDNRQAGVQEMFEPSRPATPTTVQSNPFRECSTSSPPSLTHSGDTSSMRTSISTIQRPPSSRRGLSITKYKQHSRPSSSDGPSRRPSQDEGFDSWDTSGVSPHMRETVFQTKIPNKGPGLEPIPGSRSPSPAKTLERALEGPFFQTSPSSSPPASPLPQPSVSQPNSPPASPLDGPLNLPNFSTMFPPPSPPPSGPPPATPRQQNFSRPGSRSGPVSRSGSIAVPRSRQGSRSRAPSEDHIHPLFRTSSPTPPPSASANTTVTAAPEGGQYINERMLKRMRSGSLPSSPSPLVRSESSPDIRAIRVPPSPSLETMPFLNASGPRPTRPHQRKRSASFQSTVDA